MWTGPQISPPSRGISFDSAGSLFNLIRWTSTRTIKETSSPPRDWTNPFMAEK